jgi:hypothetical protein
VSKKALTGIGLFPVKNESGRQRPAEFTKASERERFALIAAHFENALAGDANLDLVAFLKVERINHSRGQADRKAVSPFRYLHWVSMIYIAIVYLQEDLCKSI